MTENRKGRYPLENLSEQLRRVRGRLIKNGLYPSACITMEKGILRIDSVRRIIACCDVYIRVSSADMTIEVYGTGLEISSAEPDSITVEGNISSLEFT